MKYVKPKKHLGQHFLRDEAIAKRITESLTGFGNYKTILEIGPGTGVLTKYLIQSESLEWWGMDVDDESVLYLKHHYPEISSRVIHADFLSLDINDFFQQQQIAIIGNFPYNISSQILFKLLEYRNQIPELVGMFQKEVAMRVVAGPGGKVNGILSILCQAFYDVEYLFQVNENVFDPPPKVKSAVIRFKRNERQKLDCDEKSFFAVVKTAYNQRRKTLRNSLKAMQIDWEKEGIGMLSGKRAEELSVDDFIKLTNAVSVL